MEIHIIGGIKQNHIYAIAQMDCVPMDIFNYEGVSVIFKKESSEIMILRASTREELYKGVMSFDYGEKVLIIKLVDVLSKENSELLQIETADKLVQYVSKQIDTSKFDSRAIMIVFEI